MNTTTWLFSYGTLQQPEVQSSTFGRLLRGEPDHLVGFVVDKVAITDPDVVALSGSAEHPILRRSSDPNARVAGTALEVRLDDLERADSYEVDDYERILVTLQSGRRAYVYIERGG